MEAIILAGGLGTRLRSAVPDLPKCMAEIQKRPFLEYLLDNLIAEGVKSIVFSVGYKSEFIQNHFGICYKDCKIQYAIEETLLGTGGAIKNAMKFTSGKNVVVLNGDSMILTDLKSQLEFHEKNDADVTFALKPMDNPHRYGTIELNEGCKVLSFNEKQTIDFGLINTGCYIFKRQVFDRNDLPEKFSIESDFFQKEVNELNFYGFQTNRFFLDIGIPSDFEKAQTEVGILPSIDSSWTIFLDRDGVINKRIVGDYVRNTDQFELLEGAVEAIVNFSKIFAKVFVVTNQQGIGKGLMTDDDLKSVHDELIKQVESKGGKIDQIYYAPQLASENSPMRKPNPGMALKAKSDFPEVDLSKSIMIGDSVSDMGFAVNAGILPIYLNDTEEQCDWYKISSLHLFSNLLDSILQ